MIKRTVKLLIISLFILLITKSATAITPEELLNLDLSKNYKSYNLSELRLIRSMIYARHGFLFTESELRNYFLSNFKWYDTIVHKNAELEYTGKTIPPIILTEKEQKFVDKIDRLIAERCRDNFYTKNKVELPDLENIANRFETKQFPDNFHQILKDNGFVIEKDTHEQLFHVYDKNRYSFTPSFVTTDLFLQLFHTYFAYTLKDLEKEKLSGLVSSLTEAMYFEAAKYAGTSKNPKVVKMANFNACFFAIAYTLLTDKKLNVAKPIVGAYLNELVKIDHAQDGFSAFFNSPMAYSLFVPRGYYTRTEEQKRYFKAMMWLQIAPYCLNDNELLQNACFNAYILKYGKEKLNKPIRDNYNAIYEPIAFLIGDADNLSINDICNAFDKYKITNVEWLADKKITDLVAMYLRDVEAKQDKIKPKIILSCQPKINFMPQRYLVDNDILQQFVDVRANAEKAFPKGLEVFSSLGVDGAKDVLFNFYHENQKWTTYDTILRQQTDKFKTFADWNKTVYNKWLQCLIKLNKVDKTYPSFMQAHGWMLKNLNTSLASWAELKHDVILYGEQPMAAEMGDGGDELPPPVTVGYVEPNIDFWIACKELMDKNDKFLSKYNLKTEELATKTKNVKSFIDFFISCSQKELKHQALSTEEYNRIENIGGEFDYISLSMLTPYVNYSAWEEVKGPDKTIAVVADVYTRNVPYCPKNAILHEGTGYGNTIQVIVEINGLLYLTRGAVFSYYEFPYDERLTNEKWIKLLDQNKVSPVKWMNEITTSN